MNKSDDTTRSPQKSRRYFLIALFAVVTLATVGVTALLVTIFEHKQESRTPFVRLVEVNEISTDPVPWGTNWPIEFDSYRRTVDDSETQFGGSSAMPASKLEAHPWLRRLYAGYAFSIDYREARGHAYMLFDQEVTERVTKTTAKRRVPALPCVDHSHLSPAGTGSRRERSRPTSAGRRLQLAGRDGRLQAPRAEWTTHAAHAELLKTPDGTPGVRNALFPGGVAAKSPAEESSDPAKQSDAEPAQDPHIGEGHPVGCIDCHDPKTMQVRVTRPGFIHGIAALAESDDPVPHLAEHRALARRRSQAAVRSERRCHPAGDAQLRLRAVPRRVLLRDQRNAVLSLGQGPEGRADRSRPTTSTSFPTARRSTISSTARPAPTSTRPSIRSSSCGARASTPAAA